MKAKLKAKWRLVGDFNIMDGGHGFYMIKVDVERD